ncbi:hypothetical protein SCUCBS95973_008045 [Sporothrix curviconia]|uniref:Molybdate-anion transporter n=1 Tax=Sporothrix curviconia TaxID=1260050 RepID=A0ABP0CI90_9PEZI
MDVYKANLAGILGLCAALYAGQHFWQPSAEPGSATDGTPAADAGDAKTPANKANKAKQSKLAERAKGARASREVAAAAHAARASAFLTVYALVMAADWLQGPFLYALYTDEHGVAPARVPLLFATGFVAGGVSASFVGSAADRHGRKRACLVFCATYAASCILTVAFASLPVLLAGRILGGISTSLLFSVFESWMVTDFWENEKYGASMVLDAGDDDGDDDGDDAKASAAERKKEKDEAERQASARLSHTFGQMGTLNSLAAITSGVFSDWVVGATGTAKAPFVASAVLLAVAAWRIAVVWEENYGDNDENQKGGGGGGSVLAVLTDPPVLVLGLASTLFEGSMYLFVFFWTPALKETAAAAAEVSHSSASSSLPSLPYGIIFASFMAAAMAATLAFNVVTIQLRLLRCISLLLGLLVSAEIVFYLLSSSSPSSSSSTSAGLAEQTVFWLFCLFEACVGTYWPCMGFLKGRLVPDGARAQVYALLRVPLNLFVVAALLLTRDGSYATVFGACSTLLMAAIAGVLAMVLNEPNLP